MIWLHSKPYLLYSSRMHYYKLLIMNDLPFSYSVNTFNEFERRWNIIIHNHNTCFDLDTFLIWIILLIIPPLELMILIWYNILTCYQEFLIKIYITTLCWWLAFMYHLYGLYILSFSLHLTKNNSNTFYYQISKLKLIYFTLIFIT